VRDRAHAIVVERKLETDCRFKAADTNDLVRRRIFHDKQVALLVECCLAAYGTNDAIDTRGKRRAIGLECRQPGAGFIGQCQYGVEIARLDTADNHHCLSPCSVGRDLQNRFAQGGLWPPGKTCGMISESGRRRKGPSPQAVGRSQ